MVYGLPGAPCTVPAVLYSVPITQVTSTETTLEASCDSDPGDNIRSAKKPKKGKQSGGGKAVADAATERSQKDGKKNLSGLFSGLFLSSDSESSDTELSGSGQSNRLLVGLRAKIRLHMLACFLALTKVCLF